MKKCIFLLGYLFMATTTLSALEKDKDYVVLEEECDALLLESGKAEWDQDKSLYQITVFYHELAKKYQEAGSLAMASGNEEDAIRLIEKEVGIWSSKFEEASDTVSCDTFNRRFIITERLLKAFEIAEKRGNREKAEGIKKQLYDCADLEIERMYRDKESNLAYYEKHPFQYDSAIACEWLRKAETAEALCDHEMASSTHEMLGRFCEEHNLLLEDGSIELATRPNLDEVEIEVDPIFSRSVSFSKEDLLRLEQEGVNVSQRERVEEVTPIFFEGEYFGSLVLLEKGEIWLTEDSSDEMWGLVKGNELIIIPEGEVINDYQRAKKETFIFPWWGAKQLGFGDFPITEEATFVGTCTKKAVIKVTNIEEGRCFFSNGTSLALEDQIDIECLKKLEEMGEYTIPDLLKKAFLFELPKVEEEVVLYEIELSKEFYENGLFRKEHLYWIESHAEGKRASWTTPKRFPQEGHREKNVITHIFPISCAVAMQRYDQIEKGSFYLEIVQIDSGDLFIVREGTDYWVRLEVGDEVALKENELMIPLRNGAYVEMGVQVLCKSLESVSLKTISHVSEEGYLFEDGSTLSFSELVHVLGTHSGVLEDDWDDDEEDSTSISWESVWKDEKGHLTAHVKSVNSDDLDASKAVLEFPPAFRSLFIPETFQAGDKVYVYRMRGSSYLEELGLPEEIRFVLLQKA